MRRVMHATRWTLLQNVRWTLYGACAALRPWRDDPDLERRALALLRRSMDDANVTFHAGQWETIQSLCRRGWLLVIQRTGWGKSSIYFITTALLRATGAGPTIIVSPLLALMRDQVAAAQRMGLCAITINSSADDTRARDEARLRVDDVDVLLISPERLADERFTDGVLRPLLPHIGLFVVDEAHCISDWGHDFRPDYRRLADIVRALPRSTPVLATTATATDRVVEDIRARLGRLRVTRGPLTRSSLRLQSIELPGPAARLAWLAEHLPLLPGSGIVYALSVRDTRRVAAWLRAQGIDAAAYNASLDVDARADLEARLLGNRVKALVATPALAMGFDKPDLGFVAHYQRPGSLPHYYQQVGRAGRALDTAYGVLLGGPDDAAIVEYFIRTAYPPEDHIVEVMGALNRAMDGLSPTELERETDLNARDTQRVLKLLAARSPTPIRRRSGRWYVTGTLYVSEDSTVGKLKTHRREEWARVLHYARAEDCLMRSLTRALDDPATERCGRCAPCRGAPLLPHAYSPDLERRAEEFLRQADQCIPARTRWPGDAVASYGWTGNIPRTLRHEEGRALCHWGDDGWGDLVRQGKQDSGCFDDTLARATAAMVRERWAPRPAPAWVTAVPSLNHPELVPDFARRVAEELGLPFIPSVGKTRQTAPQKSMRNDYRQAHNLENAFVVEAGAGQARPRLHNGPVLLVDDIVDSGWTFAIVAALLRGAGSGPVFPLALAVAAPAEGVHD